MNIKNKLKEIKTYLWDYPYLILVAILLILWSIGMFSMFVSILDYVKMRNVPYIERNINEKVNSIEV